MFFNLETFEQPVILNFFLQNAQCFFNVVINNGDSNFFQAASPLSK